MSIDLTDLLLVNAVPTPFNGAAVQKPQYGSAFRIDRLGSRWAIQMTTPPMDIEPDWRMLSARFDDAERVGGLFAIPQPGFDVGTPGAPVIATNTAAGRLVPLTGLTPRYEIRSGQWVSFVVGGQRYCDRIAERVVADAAGLALIRLRNLIRKPLTAGDVAELARPKIEGIVEITSYPPLSSEQTTSIEFTVTEAQ